MSFLTHLYLNLFIYVFICLFIDLRIYLLIYSFIYSFIHLPGENDYTLHVGLKTGCTVTTVIDEVRQGKRNQRAYVRTDSGLRGSISVYDLVDDQIDVDMFNLTDYLQVRAAHCRISDNIQHLTNLFPIDTLFFVSIILHFPVSFITY